MVAKPYNNRLTIIGISVASVRVEFSPLPLIYSKYINLKIPKTTNGVVYISLSVWKIEIVLGATV
jgi:hypothetical protein